MRDLERGLIVQGTEDAQQLPLGQSDPEAFLRALHPTLVAGLSLHVGDLPLAEDLAQQSLLKAWLHWDRIDEAADPTAWVWRVALNLASSHFRRMSAQRRAHKRSGSYTASPRNPDVETGLVVRQAMSNLSKRQRSVLVLRYFADFSVASTAATLGIAEGTVKATTSQALRKLRDELGAALGIEKQNDD